MRAGPSWLRGDVLPIASLALLVLAVRATLFGDPIVGYDEQLYSFIGWRMQYGEWPYVDWWDRKPFGLFAIFGLAHWIGGPGPLAYQIVGVVSAAAGAGFLYILARDLLDRLSATLTAALGAVLVMGYSGLSGQSETFHIPLILAMVVLLRDPAHPHFLARACWAMLLGGLALQIKYTVLPQCGFLGLWALWSLWRRGTALPRLTGIAALFCLLGLLPTIGVAIFYAAIGEWDAFVFANFISFFDRVAGGRFMVKQLQWLLPVGIVLLGGLYAAFRMQPPSDWPRYGFFGGFFLASLATVYLPSTVYQYYFAAMVPATVLLATPLLDRRGPMGPVPGLVLLAAAVWMLQLPDRHAGSLAARADIAHMAETIKPVVDGSDNCLFVFDGPTALYRLSNSCAPSRFVYPDHMNNALETQALGIDQTAEVARILAARPPAIVVADRPVTPQNPDVERLVRQALEQDYRAGSSMQHLDRVFTVHFRR